MSLKQEIDVQITALKAYDAQDYQGALKAYEDIADSSKIFFNIGMIHATMGEHWKAVENFQNATNLDQYLAIAYFQQGVSNFLLGEFEEALANFNDALLYLRGNILIDYKQLGLDFKLFSCEVLFNRGLSYIYLGEADQGMTDLKYAVKEKQIEDHAVIEEAIRDKAEGYTVFSVPVGTIYRPSEAKIKNARKKDYLGQAKLVAATDPRDGFTGFTGAEMKKDMNQTNTSNKDEGNITATKEPNRTDKFATHALVRTDLQKSIRRPGNDQNRISPVSLKAEVIRGIDNNQKPFPVKLDSESPQKSRNLPPSPPSEPEYDVHRVPNQKGKDSLEWERDSEYRPPSKTRLPTVRDQVYDDRRPRLARSSSKLRNEAALQRGAASLSRRPTQRANISRGRSRYDDDDNDAGSVYGHIYDDYYNERPQRANTLRRAPTRGRGDNRSASRQNSRKDSFDDDDDGGRLFSDGEDDEFEMITERRRDITKIRVKVKMDGEARNVMIPVDISIKEFVTRVAEKFDVSTRRLKCKMRDEDGEIMDLRDQDDLEILVELAKEDAKLNRREFGRAEIICAA